MATNSIKIYCKSSWWLKPLICIAGVFCGIFCIRPDTEKLIKPIVRYGLWFKCGDFGKWER